MDNASDGQTSGNRRQTRSIGRAVGVANYSREDLNAIMNLVEVLRPAGKNGWQKLTKKYNALVNVSHFVVNFYSRCFYSSNTS